MKNTSSLLTVSRNGSKVTKSQNWKYKNHETSTTIKQFLKQTAYCEAVAQVFSHPEAEAKNLQKSSAIQKKDCNFAIDYYGNSCL